jgi:hypothetical protein
MSSIKVPTGPHPKMRWEGQRALAFPVSTLVACASPRFGSAACAKRRVAVVAGRPRNGAARGISAASRPFPGASYWDAMNDNPDGLLADPPVQLRAFVRDGRITAMPAKRPRRRLLLDQVAQAFEPGRRYPEPVVDEILKAVFDDHCALRRYLVDESFLSRTADGIYWRSGGTAG